MAKKCTQLTRPGQAKSELYKLILNNIAGGSKPLADELYAYFSTDDFKKDFGDKDWEIDYKTREINADRVKDGLPELPYIINQRHINDQGEPLLKVDKQKGEYYYRNKHNRLRYFPDVKKGLEKDFSNTEIITITNVLGLNYVRTKTNFNFKDINITVAQELLSESIKRQINDYANKLEEEGDEELANTLRRSDLDEWENNVKDLFKTYNLIYREETEELQEAEESARGQQQWGIASFERSSKDNISSNVKLRLSILQDESVQDDIFGEDMYVPFNAIYTLLASNLNNLVPIIKTQTINGVTKPYIEDLFDVFLSKIKEMAVRKPYLNSLLEELTDPDLDRNIKFEFVQAFNLHKNNFISVDATTKHTGEGAHKQHVSTTFSILDVSSAGSKAKTVQAAWNQKFRSFYAPGTQFKKNGKTKMRQLKSSLDSLLPAFKDKVKKGGYKTEADLEAVTGTLAAYLSKVGIDISPKALDLYLDKNDMLPTTVKERLDVIRETFNALDTFLNRALEGKELKITEGTALADQTIFNDLATAEAFFLSEETDSTVYSAGKTKWIFSNPSYLSTTVLTWKRNPELLKSILETAYGASSVYVRHLLALDKSEKHRAREMQKRLNELEVTTFNTFRELNDKEAKDNKTISNNDFNAVVINSMLQPIPYYFTPTPADKGNHHMIRIGKFIDTGATYYKDRDFVQLNEKAVYEVFLNYFASEYARIAQTHAEIEEAGENTENLRVHYHIGRKNGLKSQLFPTLSPENFEKYKKGFSFRLYDENGKPKVKDLTTLRYTKKEINDLGLDASLEGKNKIIEEFIKPLLSKQVLSVYKTLQEKSIFERNEDGEIVAKGIDESIVNDYKGKSEKQFALKIAADTFINGLISQVEYAKMFAGDIAFYKNPVDYKKRIPATYTDGLPMTLSPGEENFNISVVEGVEISTPYLDKLKKMLPPDVWKAYADNKINAADAQAWITPQRWKFILQRVGKWSPDMDAIYDKMMNQVDAVYEEHELKKLAQPLKGVYFQRNKGVPVFLKYSQAVLIPSLVKNTPLQKIYDKMVEGTKANDADENLDDYNSQIHEVITIDGVKVGAIQPVLTHDKKTGKMLDDFTLTKDVLSNTGWKLQQDLPVKTFKDTKLGSQLQKNIFAGIADHLNETFYVGDSPMTGTELFQQLNQIVATLSDKGKASLMDEFTISNGRIGNMKALTKSIIEELKSSGGNKDVIKALERELGPYGIPQAKDKLMNIFASMFLNRLVKIKTNGGSFIQLSNYGISKEEGDRDGGIIWSPALEYGETTFEPHFLEDEKGEFILREDGSKIVRPGGVVISGSFIAKYIPNYREYSNKELFGHYNKATGKYESYKDENGKTIVPKIDNEILQGLIGYRIPNQGLASNDSLQIVGIMSEEMGDTVIAYTGITAKTGSDFDIDKMYMMMPSFIPVRPINGELRKFILKNFKKNGKKATLAALQELTEGLDLDYAVNNLANIILDDSKELKGKELKQHKQDLNQELGILIDMVKETDATLNPLAETLLIIAGQDPVNRLVYAKPITDKDGNMKPMEDQSREALNNMLIQGYKAVLTHPKIMSSIMTPIDFDFMKDDITSLHHKGESSDLDDFNPFTDIELKYEFSAGQAGVGQEANALVDHNRGRMAETYFYDLYLGRGNRIVKNGMTHTKLDDSDSETLNKADITAYMNAYNAVNDKQIDYAAAEKLATIKIADSLSAVLNGFVDIAKDPFITRGNWTTQTTNTGNMLLRAGFHPFYVNAYLGQPIVKKYVNYVTNKESKIVKDSGDLKDKFRIDIVKEKLNTMGNKQILADGTSIDMPLTFTFNEKTLNMSAIYEAVSKNLPENKSLGKSLTPKRIVNLFGTRNKKKVADLLVAHQDELAKVIETIEDIHNSVFFTDDKNVTNVPLAKLKQQITGKRSEQDTQLQISILNQFFEWQEQSKKLRASVMGSKQDVNGYGKSIGSMVTMRNTIDKLLYDNYSTGDFVGYKEKLIKDGQVTLLGAYTRNVIDWTYDIMQANPLLFFEAQKYITNSVNYISLDVKEDLLTDEKLADKIYKEYYSYLLSGFPPFNINSAEKKHLLGTQEGNFVDEFEKFKENTPKGQNVLLDNLEVTSGEGRTFITMSNRKKDADYEYSIVAAWDDLLNLEELPGDTAEEIELIRRTKKMANDLVKYAYLTSGFKMSTKQFFTFIPSSWFIKNRIDNYIIEAAQKMTQFNTTDKKDFAFIDQFYRNKTEDNQLVPTVRFGVEPTGVYGGLRYIEPGIQRKYIKREIKSTIPELMGKKITQFYKLIGYDFQSRAIYQLTSALSKRDKYGNLINEYKFGENIDNSQIRSNQIELPVENVEAIKKLVAHNVEHFDPVINTGKINLRPEPNSGEEIINGCN